MKRLLAFAPILGVLALAPTRGGRAANPMGPNAACYVCHPAFVKEELSSTHLRKKVTCIKCHGLSARHANDEDIGATKPDRTYNRGEVSAMCRRCHKTHNVPPEAVIARWVERKLTDPPPICTDCHGRHRVETAAEGQGK